MHGPMNVRLRGPQSLAHCVYVTDLRGRGKGGKHFVTMGANPSKLFSSHIFPPFFIAKLGHFIVNAFLHMYQTVTINNKNRKPNKNKVWLN